MRLHTIAHSNISNMIMSQQSSMYRLGRIRILKAGGLSESTMHLVNVSAFNYALYRKGSRQEVLGCWMVNESAKIVRTSSCIPSLIFYYRLT